MNILNQTQLETARNFFSLAFMSPAVAADSIKDLPISVRAAVAYAWSDFMVTTLMVANVWGDAEAHEAEEQAINDNLMRVFVPELVGVPKAVLSALVEDGSDILRGYKLDFPRLSQVA